jgi:hypothetical protein
MSTDLHIVKGKPDADELAAVVIALDLVRARRQKAEPASRWRSSARRQLGAAQRATTWARSLRAR